MWHFTIGKKIRVATRGGVERLKMFADEIDLMTRTLEARDTPFVLGFLKWRTRDIHYVASAHLKMAARFCQVISGATDRSCVPPDWHRESRL